MSQLSLYCPPVEVEDDEPRVFRLPNSPVACEPIGCSTSVTRARVEKENRACPCCHRASVQPLELGDAVRNRNGAKVPGTATVVGFRCSGCRHEWPGV